AHPPCFRHGLLRQKRSAPVEPRTTNVRFSCRQLYSDVFRAIMKRVHRLMHHMTPKQIVAELDRYIVGQGDAKRAVAVAIRNRWRRQQLSESLRADVMPKNILMIGPTGVGKTEIARRLAGLTGAPFIKVEATKYTEVGYHGRDV